MSNDKPMKNLSAPADVLELVKQLRTQQEALREQLRLEQTTLQTLARRLWLQQEHERAKLSRELHDGVGQLLTGLKTQLGQAAKTNNELESLYHTASAAVESIRSLSRLMHPTVLTDLGIAAAISWLNRQMLQPAGVACETELDIPSNIDMDLQIFLFRIIQEAMVNTVKHARAQRFSIYLMYASDSLRLDMLDNGKGFVVGKETEGLGLQSMRDRCEAFGAHFTISSSPGNGCQISISLPYQYKEMPMASDLL
ncbi:two-component system, NarL family, sensor kinase [Pseudidiomarina planktonica]|uniref:histidine kinase n=2 Tax=Pseudidiomarina planktonica TaxID=1323738 RepID=A0A1Y6E859_9GAMM|nr:two-component system, NarL family, sensor kinase [Pseudidiomarina planktonica]